MINNVSKVKLTLILFLIIILVPPYGQEEIQEIQSIFEVSHLRSQAKFLNIQCK